MEFLQPSFSKHLFSRRGEFPHQRLKPVSGSADGEFDNLMELFWVLLVGFSARFSGVMALALGYAHDVGRTYEKQVHRR